MATTSLDGVAQFPSFDAYWRALDVRQGSLAAYLSSLSDDMRAKILAQRSELTPRQPDGSIRLRLRAFAVRGRRVTGGGQ